MYGTIWINWLGVQQKMANKVVTNKSSKNEILEAYNVLLGEVEALSDNDRVQKQKRSREAEIVVVAKSNNTSDIVHKITHLKIEVGQSLDELGKQLVMEREKLSTLQSAIDIATGKLEDTHQIIANADSLEALMLAQKKKREEFDKEWLEKRMAFDKEISEKKEAWDKEQGEYNLNKKEKEEAYKKEQKRREEEYEYQRKLKEQKDADQYEIKQANLERELAEKKQSVEKALQEREALVIAQESELKDLRLANASFAGTLKSKIEEITTSLTSNLEKQYKFEKELQAKEVEGQVLLYKKVHSI